MSEPTAAEQVSEIADRQIEAIRLMLCPDESDVELADDGTMDTVLQLDCDLTFRYSDVDREVYADENGEFDLEDFVSDNWDEIRDQAYERFHEHGLSFDYKESDDGEPGYFCYLISTGGPGTEIRFYTDPGFNLYKAEFWYLPWFDGAQKTVTNDPTIQILWEQFRECSAEHVYQEATSNND